MIRAALVLWRPSPHAASFTRLPSVPVPYLPVRPWSLFFRCSAAALFTPVVTDALMNAGQKYGHCLQTLLFIFIVIEK